MAKREKWYELVEDFCTAAQIHALLQPHKEAHKDEIRLTGTKEELIDVLKRAVAKKIVAFTDVIDLIREHEENGNQHIFYFVPASERVRKLCSSPDEVEVRLLGEDHGHDFPKFDLVPDEFVWADFRVGAGIGKPKDWMAKLYGFRRVPKFIEIQNMTRDTFAKVYRYEDERSVIVVRWNSPGLLEIRVQSTESRKLLFSRLAKAQELLRPLLSERDMKPWSLKSAARELVKCRLDHKEIYKIHATGFRDSAGGIARFIPNTEDEEIGEVAERKLALDAYVEGEATECDSLALHWLPEKTKGILSDSLRVVLGSYREYEVSIQSRTSSKAVDYVTNRLREFSA